MYKTLILIVFFLGNISVGLAQDLTFIEHEKAIPFEKVYLQTDREFYFMGDTLWFATYLVNAQSHTPIAGKCNLYVDLINAEGDFIRRELFMLDDGTCPGYLSFYDKTLEEGNYLLRAYTDYLKPFGDDLYFSKSIKLLKVKNSFGFNEEAENTTPQKIDLQFFPEGGFLLNGVINHVAFTATDENGRAIDVNGRVVDNTGKELLRFETAYKGMGRFIFIPETTNTYFVEINGTGDRFELPEIRKKGAKLMAGLPNNEFVNVVVLTPHYIADQKYSIAVLHRGEGLAILQPTSASLSKSIKISNEYLRPGINRLVLLDEKMEPVSERLVFMDFKDEINIAIKLNATALTTRDKVDLTLELPDNLASAETAKLSMVVVNENILNASGPSQNMKSYLLADSELKGNIDAPLDYFSDDDKLTSGQKLDLLMLTHGWRNYLWNTIRSGDVDFEPKAQQGISFSGMVKAPNNKKVVANTEVVFSLGAGSESYLIFGSTDLNGYYAFNNIVFHDSALVLIQGKNRRDKTNTTTVLDDPWFAAPELGRISEKKLKDFHDIPVSAFRMKYLNELALEEFYPDRNSRMLGEINILGQKKEEPEDEHFRIYGTPDYSIKVDENSYMYTNIFQFLVGRVPGVQVVGEEINIRGATSLSGGDTNPLFVLDGIPTDKDMVADIPMADVDKVEVLKGASAAIFGMRGANGVVIIFTKTGASSDYISQPIPGTVIKKIKGFAPYREFYSPQYTASNISSVIPDFRTTLYWNPKILMDQPTKSFSFFTCDNLSHYKVFLEGITSDGRICLGEADFVVDRRREN
ncbi:TonB-dependent receptor plug domain-containing protein [Maribellus sediminis]|uniref:TonB-dependent receptor plug domain-containing protein n=1 Tax=Maribellus sediminis TaxID=2696285 RepID=UPI00142F4CA8|nr:TonB-dependent receptor plug domain-containing protein [Maribellus sediminis]